MEYYHKLVSLVQLSIRHYRNSKRSIMALPKRVKIREVGPREGFQTLEKVVSTADKLKLIEALSKTGVKEIEATSFVRPDLVPQMADAEDLVKKLKSDSIRYTALYLNIKGFEKAEQFSSINNDAWIQIAASETFLKKNNNIGIADLISKLPDWFAAFSKAKKSLHGLMLSTAFGCNYEGPIKLEKVIKVLDSVVENSKKNNQQLKEVCLADTMGWATPPAVKDLVNATGEKFPELDISLHFHDTRGTGIANVYAGLEAGVSVFDCSVGGLGGCPFAKGAAGNVATEDVLYLCEELGLETGISLEAYVKAAKLAEDIIGKELPGKYYKAHIFRA